MTSAFNILLTTETARIPAGVRSGVGAAAMADARMSHGLRAGADRQVTGYVSANGSDRSANSTVLALRGAG